MYKKNGFSLFISILMTLLMASLAFAMSKATDLSTQITQAREFKKNTEESSDYAQALAINYLVANAGNLNDDKPQDGYYSTETEVDPQGINTAKAISWTGQGTNLKACKVSGVNTVISGSNQYKIAQCNGIDPLDDRGIQYAFFIQRMCDKSGNPFLDTSIQCAFKTTENSKIKSYAATTKSLVVYRIITQALGPKGEASYSRFMYALEE